MSPLPPILFGAGCALLVFVCAWVIGSWAANRENRARDWVREEIRSAIAAHEYRRHDS